MSDKELIQLILASLNKLDNKLDTLTEEVSNLKIEAELIKRDKVWARYMAGIVGGGISIVASLIFGK
jgi:hypothetical protein